MTMKSSGRKHQKRTDIGNIEVNPNEYEAAGIKLPSSANKMAITLANNAK